MGAVRVDGSNYQSGNKKGKPEVLPESDLRHNLAFDLQGQMAETEGHKRNADEECGDGTVKIKMQGAPDCVPEEGQISNHYERHDRR